MKKYFVKKHDLEQAERMLDKLYYHLEITLFDAMVAKMITSEECAEKSDETQQEIDNLEEALNIAKAGNMQAEWKYVDLIHRYAAKRDELDAGIKNKLF